jgi:hypothetical protein
MACAAQYNARILELRRAGFNIPKPRIETVNGQKHTWYRLLPSASAPISSFSAEKPLKSWEQVCAEREEKMRQQGPSFELVP